MTQLPEAAGKNCRPMATDLALTESGQYPPEMVVGGPNGFAGECKEATNYASEDGRFVVRLWQSEAGVLQTDSYPFDEYFLVLEGHVIITNRPLGKPHRVQGRRHWNAGEGRRLHLGHAGLLQEAVRAGRILT